MLRKHLYWFAIGLSGFFVGMVVGGTLEIHWLMTASFLFYAWACVIIQIDGRFILKKNGTVDFLEETDPGRYRLYLWLQLAVLTAASVAVFMFAIS